jgi:hypothetical protein
MMPASDHSEVINALTELYNMLNTLAAVPPGAFWLPKSIQNAYESDTGHEEVFDTDAAKAAGFNAEGVRLLASIPYWDHPIYIEPSTRTKCHLGQSSNLVEERELFMVCDELLPPSAVRLTESSSIYGTDSIYDVETSEKAFGVISIYQVR